MAPISLMLSRAIQDSNPEMKQKAALFVGKLSKELSEKVGVYLRSSVQSLAGNLAH